MKRSDAVVLSISVLLAVVALAATAFSVTVLDHEPDSLPGAQVSAGADSSLLVVTWGPAFCEVAPGNPGCRSGQVGALGPTLILHGLWPQPAELQYCGLPPALADRVREGKKSNLPPVELNDGVRQGLRGLLSNPEAMIAHEWYTHGVCSDVGPDEYFGDAAALTLQAREALDPLLAGAQGGPVELTAIRQRFDDDFGAGAGARVALSCRNVTGQGSVAYEILLSLPPADEFDNGDEPLSLGPLLLAGPPITSHCSRGAVA